MHLKWMKCRAAVWCMLKEIDLDHEHFRDLGGVYVIWHGGENPAVVYVGQGIVADRLREQRTDPRIQQFAKQRLYVSWCAVPPQSRDGVEVYWACQWNPRVSDNRPETTPIAVNSPWD